MTDSAASSSTVARRSFSRIPACRAAAVSGPAPSRTATSSGSAPSRGTIACSCGDNDVHRCHAAASSTGALVGSTNQSRSHAASALSWTNVGDGYIWNLAAITLDKSWAETELPAFDNTAYATAISAGLGLPWGRAGGVPASDLNSAHAVGSRVQSVNVSLPHRRGAVGQRPPLDLSAFAAHEAVILTEHVLESTAQLPNFGCLGLVDQPVLDRGQEQTFQLASSCALTAHPTTS